MPRHVMPRHDPPRWLWFDQAGVMHLDGPGYAEARGIPLEDAMRELEDIARQLLPDAKVTTR